LSKPKISSVANPDRDPVSGIRCLFDPWIRDLGSRIGIRDRLKVRIQIRDLDPGWKTRIIFLKAEKPFFLLKYLNSLMRIRDPTSGMEKNQIRGQGSRMVKIWIQDLGSGMEKIQIRDPRSRINIPDQQNWKSCRQIC
jgi:hypothetical protein